MSGAIRQARETRETKLLVRAVAALRDESEPLNVGNVDMLGTLAMAARIVATHAENLRDILSGGGTGDSLTVTVPIEDAALAASMLKELARQARHGTPGQRAFSTIGDELERHVPFDERVRA